MKTKKLMALLMAMVMLLGCLAACSTPDNGTTTKAPNKESTGAANEGATDAPTEEPTTEEQSLFNGPGELPIVNEPVTLKVLTQHKTSNGANASTAGVWEWLEKQTGIHFEVESYTLEELASKIPLIMSTPDQMPDLFLYANINDADIVQYGQNGQLLQLDDLIEQYGVNIKQMFEEVDEAYGGAVSSDGKIYAVPSINGKPSVVQYAINTRFLENAGIDKIPTTLEELYDAMVIMRKCDPNGDGIVGNELLWSGVPKIFKRQALSMVGIACYWPFEGCIFDDKDGEVYFVPTSDEYKYLLTYLRDMYKIGALDPEVFTQSTNQYKDKFYQDLTFIGERVDDPESSGYKGLSGSAWVTPFTSAVHDTPIVIKGADYTVNTGAISAYTEYPEICMMVLDYLYSEDATRVSAYGFDGVDYKVVTEDPWVLEKISNDIAIGQGPTCLSLPKWIRERMVQKGVTKLAVDKYNQQVEYGVVGWQNYVKLTAEEADSINVLSADLGFYCDDYFAGFITGTYDLEKDWDAYVKTCESMKVDELTKVYQAAYDRYVGK